MSTLTKDIATILEDNGFGEIGKNIFVSQDAPPKPDLVLNIKNFGTALPDLPTIALEYISVQIIARASKGGHQECETIIYSIKNFLKTISNYYVNDSRFVFINHQSGPVDIGIDTLMRPLYALNVLCLRTDVFSLGICECGENTYSTSYIDLLHGLVASVLNITSTVSQFNISFSLRPIVTQKNYCFANLTLTS